jgi:rhamnulokinase
MGLWVLTEMLRLWGRESDLESLLAEAGDAPALASIVDVDDQAFLPPGVMESPIVDGCHSTGQPVPGTPGAFVRCVLESLAVAYRRTIRLAGSLSGRTIEAVHVVGGRARHALLCQLTADACGVPVLAGRVEATALGNVLVQARALGADVPGLPAMRALVRQTHQPRRFEPTGDLDWDGAEARLLTSERQRDDR